MQRPQWVNALVSGARIILLSVLAIWSHACGPVVQLASSAAVGALLGYTGLKKGSLSKSGIHLLRCCTLALQLQTA